MNKQEEIKKVRDLQAEIAKRINGWPIYQSQISGAIVGIGFWLDEAVSSLEATELQSEILVPQSLDEAIARKTHQREMQEMEERFLDEVKEHAV